jgi:hypothetical protein
MSWNVGVLHVAEEDFVHDRMMSKNVWALLMEFLSDSFCFPSYKSLDACMFRPRNLLSSPSTKTSSCTRYETSHMHEFCTLFCQALSPKIQVCNVPKKCHNQRKKFCQSSDRYSCASLRSSPADLDPTSEVVVQAFRKCRCADRGGGKKNGFQRGFGALYQFRGDSGQ